MSAPPVNYDRANGADVFQLVAAAEAPDDVQSGAESVIAASNSLEALPPSSPQQERQLCAGTQHVLRLWRAQAQLE